MNNAIEKCNYFADGFYPETHPDPTQRYEEAKNAISELRDFYKINRRYISKEASKILDELWIFLTNETWIIYGLIVASNFLDTATHSLELKVESEKMREEILETFRE